MNRKPDYRASILTGGGVVWGFREEFGGFSEMGLGVLNATLDTGAGGPLDANETITAGSTHEFNSMVGAAIGLTSCARGGWE